MSDEILALLDQIEVKWEEVPYDDMGDPCWKWHATYWLGTDCIWDDYFRTKPDSTRVYNTLLESVKDGSLGEKLRDYLNEYENYDKMLNERKV